MDVLSYVVNVNWLCKQTEHTLCAEDHYAVHEFKVDMMCLVSRAAA